LRLYCFPYAGGGASVYRSWSDLSDEVEVLSVQLPGRESRFAEGPDRDLSRIVESLAEAVEALGSEDQPFCFFGHSLGALVCFEVARALRRRQCRAPLRLFVSASRAPQLPFTRERILGLPDAEFLARLREYGGTPDAVLDDREFMSVILPVIRADIGLNEGYQYVPEAPLATPIVAFAGSRDALSTFDEVEEWRAQTTGAFRIHRVEGDHFFLDRSKELIHEAILTELSDAGHLSASRYV
jgi:surfactin synthase thioesterase subunit